MSNASAPLRYGMIGGGRDAFIGAVHRMAVALDQQAVLIAGALSSSPEKSRASGKDLGFADDRNYGSWQEMLERESALPAEERVDFVSIVTPNHTHYEIAMAFVEAGFNVVLDKPMVHTCEQAQRLVEAVDRKKVVFAVTYNYTGYPLVRQAREMVQAGELGAIRKVFVEYHQGWLATQAEAGGSKQAEWRTDPARSGIAGAVGDIGTHAENLVHFITGLELEQVAADLTAFVPNRRLDDDASVLLRFRGGAKGVLTCSQICHGEENALAIRIYGERGALKWRQEEPNHLIHIPSEGPQRILTRGGAGTGALAAASTRIPPGHPEAFIEAFANIYRGTIAAIRASRTGEKTSVLAELAPSVRDGERGVAFIEAVVSSARNGANWVKLGEAV